MSDGVLRAALGLVIAYLLGSIPAAYIAGRAHGIDLRTKGSGNLGATNAWRVLGWKTGLAVYLFDTLKGALPVALLPGLLGAAPAAHWALGYGIAAIAGHVKPVFLRGQGGGKGVATAGGVFAAFVPAALGVSFLVFAVTFVASGYVSLGSILAAAALPIAVLAFYGVAHPAFAVSVLVSGFVIWAHRANVGRLRRGEENRFRVFGRGPATRPPETR